jgi:hypothetical protein
MSAVGRLLLLGCVTVALCCGGNRLRNIEWRQKCHRACYQRYPVEPTGRWDGGYEDLERRGREQAEDEHMRRHCLGQCCQDNPGAYSEPCEGGW